MRRFAMLPIAVAFLACGCASSPVVKSEAYAELRNHRTFEYEFPAVWKAIEETLRNTKVTDRDPDEVNDLEMRKLARRTLKTDWAYGRSRDKYQEYTVNDTPRKVFLQERTRFVVTANRVMGGVDVIVGSEEEIEKLNSDGSSAGYDSVENPDSSRAAEMLDKIANQILAAPPSGAAP